MHLPPMLFQQFRRENKFEQCPSCNRILYYRPALTSDSSSAP
jgi:predicted  nucleic acid-binding Zn-ribbon protein